jgi:hypothetical protein
MLAAKPILLASDASNDLVAEEQCGLLVERDNPWPSPTPCCACTCSTKTSASERERPPLCD